ncbi:MAG: hypothetical protein ACOX7D_02155 [Alphaproteobacteria bacterium]
MAGIVKTKKDTEIENYSAAIAALETIKNNKDKIDFIEIVDKVDFERKIRNSMKQEVSMLSQTNNDENINVNNSILEQKRIAAEEKSKNLGNLRTGLMVGSTVTNVAGTVISAKNKIKDDLKDRIEKCNQSVKVLSEVKQQARINNSINEKENKTLDNIINKCGKWDYIDINKINNRASGAMISSIVGTGAGVAGTITSASVNSSSIRNNDTEDIKKNNLNNASNVLAGTSAGASLISTVFNATQINTIKKASEIADGCEEALK